VPFTDQQERAAAAAYGSGQMSLHSLGAKYGVSGDTIARRLRARGVEIRPRGRPLAAGPPGEPPRDVLRLHHRGLPPRDIAAELGSTDPAEIARQLRAAGLIPHRGRPIPAGADLSAAKAGIGSIRALARRYGVAEYRIRAALRDVETPHRVVRQGGSTSSAVSPPGPPVPARSIETTAPSGGSAAYAGLA
jgi:hypothetical protein